MFGFGSDLEFGSWREWDNIEETLRLRPGCLFCFGVEGSGKGGLLVSGGVLTVNEGGLVVYP